MHGINIRGSRSPCDVTHNPPQKERLALIPLSAAILSTKIFTIAMSAVFLVFIDRTIKKKKKTFTPKEFFDFSYPFSLIARYIYIIGKRGSIIDSSMQIKLSRITTGVG